MPKPAFQPETVHPGTRRAWREWLAENHATSPGVWLVFDKKGSGKRELVYAEAVEEALCFGWIDSLTNKLDEHRYKQLYSPRKPKSAWSKLNKQRVEKLIDQGLMTPAGLGKIEASKRDDSWSVLDAVEELTVPPDLEAALTANPTAREYFTAFPASVKKGILWWIESAKRPETRAKRVEETVALAARNVRANQYRP
jgi:uncharacterized protein YdeI (YjbR/CyaY-like superfamily)